MSAPERSPEDGAQAGPVGLLGGAFDPPHLGHLAVARAAIAHFALSRLLVVVTGQAPHKSVRTDPEIRFRLASAAFAGAEGVELSRHELDRPGPSYTLETARWARERFGDVVFVVGADEFADFLDWHRPDDVLEQVRLGVATRPGVDRARFQPVLASLARPERVELFEVEPVPVSSRDLRARAGRGEPLDGLVPEAVARLVVELDLYRGEGVASTNEAVEEQPGPASPEAQAVEALVRRIAEIAQEKLASDLVVLDMRGYCSFTDYFVICSGRNPRQTAAIAEEIALAVKRETRLVPRSRAGEREGAWVVLDYLDIVVHVFTPETRELYRLEELWGDVPKLAVGEPAAPPHTG